MPSIEEQMENMKYGKKYKTTRKNVVIPRSSGRRFTKEEETGKWKLRTVFTGAIDSKYTFFPFYDTDRNSFIRLYRLHKKYKEERKKYGDFYKADCVDRNVFKECLLKMNKVLLETLVHEGEKFKIGKDSIEPYKLEGQPISSNFIPLIFLWIITNPAKVRDEQSLLFPREKFYVGRILAKATKEKYKYLKTDLNFMKGFKTYKQLKSNYFRKDYTPVEIEELGYNMFDDF